MTCACKNPQVRISEVNGRVFCASCRTYLDSRPQTTPEPLRAPPTPETGIAPLRTPGSGGDDSQADRN